MPLYGVLAVLAFAVGAMAFWVYTYVSSLQRGIRLQVVTLDSDHDNPVRTHITVTNTGKLSEDYVVVLIFVTVDEHNPLACDIVRSTGIQPLQTYELERETEWESLRSWAFVYTVEDLDPGDILELQLRSRYKLDSVRMIATSSEISDSYSYPPLPRSPGYYGQ